MTTMLDIENHFLPPVSELRAQIRQFIVENFLFADETVSLPDDASFLEAGIIDSTGVLELTGFLERQFGIEIADDELAPENLDSICSLVRFVRSKCD